MRRSDERHAIHSLAAATSAVTGWLINAVLREVESRRVRRFFLSYPFNRIAIAITSLLRRGNMVHDFLEALRVQRWDDHRYYHHSRINQSLHLVSAASFVFAYMMVFKDPAFAALIGWLVAMTSRQIGHFFFEPRDYDVVNQ